ncbi:MULTISPECIES: YciI family protein [Vitreoscilla]|uniref:YciI family protein n=1 Tax=Vitreoscilla stercoraria TaxID=61 RepID=A0ABY4E8A2_VITST|nr:MULTISPECIES: YciI family protein [Vitreoscilla]AUZ04263.1 YciI-like protein [Vitreoscilla sp. C1]UOO91991.1 YciI family protein [Vitreoscilla stercoraria]
MLYMILATDVDDSTALRQEHRPAHLARLEQMKADGRLLLAGPTPYPEQEGVSGSLIVAEFETLDAAEEWASQDPFALNGIYTEVLIKPFRVTLEK